MQLLTANGQQVEYRTMGPSGFLPWGNSVPPTNGMLGGTNSGQQVNEKRALQVTAVYGSVGIIADACSTLPVLEYSGTGDPDDKRVPLRAASQLATQPYSEIDLMDFVAGFAYSLALRGNWYAKIISRDPQTLCATQLMPIHPDDVGVRRVLSGPNAGQLEYRFNGQVVNNDDVVHERNLTPPGHIEGLSPIGCLRNALGIALAMDVYSSAFFANSALPGGVIEIEGDLDVDELRSIKQEWEAGHQGSGQSHLLGVLSGGAKFSPISINPEDAQFLESKQYSAGEISGMIFRVPPHMIGIVDRTTSWGTGIEQQELGFVRNTVGKYVWRYERMISRLLRAGRYVRLDLSERLRGDSLQRGQAHALALGAGWLNKDEVRASEHLPPIPGGLGQKYYEPVTMAPLGQMGVGGPTTGAGPGGAVLTPNPMAPDAGAAKSPSGQ